MTGRRTCPQCGKPRAPLGHDVPVAKAGHYCMPDECNGYFTEMTAQEWAEWNMETMRQCLEDNDG
jgi:hypothetical protein